MKKILFLVLMSFSSMLLADYRISFSDSNAIIPEKAAVDLSKIRNIATGYGHSVVIKEDGSLYSWGRNDFQQTLVPQGNDFEKIVGGNSHTIALDSNGNLYQWGRNVGFGANFTSGNFEKLGTTALSFFALDKDGYFHGFGNNTRLPENNIIENKKFKLISSGYSNGALVDENNNVYVFGQDDSSLQKTNAPSTMDLKKLDGGFKYFAGIKSDGSIYVWGDDTYNQVTNAPQGSNFVDVSAGVYHVLALKSNGTLESWGRDSKGQVSGTPDGDGFVAVSAGGEFSLALKNDGSLVVWGDNTYNQMTDAPESDK